MARENSPGDVQWARALTAVILGLVLTRAVMHDVACAPSPRTVAPEFRALAGVPSLMIRVITGNS